MITINTNPTNKPTVQDDLWHVMTSDASGSVDFKYVIDLYVNGVQKVRIKQVPEPGTGKAYFDAGPVLRNSMTYEWFEPINSSIIVAQPDMSGQCGLIYRIEVGEDVSGVTTTNMASGEVSAFGWVPKPFRRRVDGMSDKVNKWFTNRPLYANAQSKFHSSTTNGDNLFIGFLTDTTLTPHITLYDGNGAVVQSVDGAPFTPPAGVVQLNVGPSACVSGYFPFLDIIESVQYYDIWFNSFDKFRVNLVCNPMYDAHRVHFLNRWNVWDTHRFDLVSKLTMDVERKSYQTRDHKFNGNSVDYLSASNRYYESKINFFNTTDWMYKMYADSMTDAEYEWLSDLIVSPQILLEKDGLFYPVTIKNTNYEYSKFVNNRLRPLEIDFEVNQTRHSQLR